MGNQSENVQGLTIKEAFDTCLKIRGVYKMIELDRTTVSNMRRKMLYGEFPSEKTMKEILLKTGFRIIQAELWGRVSK